MRPLGPRISPVRPLYGPATITRTRCPIEKPADGLDGFEGGIAGGIEGSGVARAVDDDRGVGANLRRRRLRAKSSREVATASRRASWSAVVDSGVLGVKAMTTSSDVQCDGAAVTVPRESCCCVATTESVAGAVQRYGLLLLWSTVVAMVSERLKTFGENRGSQRPCDVIIC
jgi:hypothetical protein